MTNKKPSVVFNEPDKREDLNEPSKKCRRTEEVREENEGTKSSLQPLPYYSLFQYANTREKLLIGLAVILAVFNGCVPPIISILYGEFCNMLVDRQYPTEAPSTKTFLLEWFGGGRILINASHEERRKALEEDSAAWSLGCATFTFCQFLVSTSSVFLLNYTALEQVSRIQVLFFKSVVCQGMAWFDTRMDGNFVGKASENLNQILNGTGGIIGIFVYLMVIFVFGVIVSLTYGWKLTLAILSTAPISIATSSIAAKVQSKLGMKEMRAYTAAGKIAEEVFGSIRTVVAFGGEEKEVARYSKKLEISKSNGIRRGVASGISGGVLWFIIYSSYAIAFAYGVRLLKNSKDDGNEEYTPAVLLIVFYGIFTGLINVGFASAHVEAFSQACVAASSIFDTIKTEPKINPCSEKGKIGKGCNGEIEFKNVRFEYPSRPQVQILKGINLKIKPGETVAIVGGSGSGKSTILQLIQRLYDPSEGEILLDGENINELRVSWLREQLGVVGQEPALFATSIRENISYGSTASVISEEDIIECSKLANAHDFIMKEPNNYESVIGEKGSTLSGGQKQRIAIARALIRKPKILLLDEATSALDSANEAIVQSTIDRAAQGRTTLIVTHRLSAIQHVNRIIVIANGVVAEEGNHAELFESRGFYYNLFEAQKGNQKKENKRLSEVSTPIPLTYENVPSTFLPSTPRSRYSSLSAFSTFSNESRVKKSGRPDQYKEVKLKQILRWNKKEWSFLMVGSAASVIAGAALPVVSVLFGNLFGLLSLKNFEDILEGTDMYSVILVIVGLIAGFCVFLQMYCFSYSEMSLTARLRVKAFTSMLNQSHEDDIVSFLKEMGWFDEEGNRVGALCLRLTRDVSGLQGATGSRLGIIVQAFSTMTIGTVLSFFFTWNMTLVTLATIPFVFGGVYLESIFVRGSKYAVNKSMENASKIAAEVIRNIRIVACLGRETYFIAKYTDAIEEGRKSNVKRGFLRALAFAVGQTAPFFGYAISLWYGGYLVASENLHYKYVIMVSELLIFGAWTLGQCVVLAPSFREAREAAGRLHYIFTRKAQGNLGELAGYLDMRKIDALTFSKVNFAYPTRPGAVVLRDFSAKIPARQSIAVVGPSGSGKSTIIQLLLRYYQPTSGKIAVNNVPLNDYRMSSLRKKMGLVSQEPTLFDRTIEENIAYGDNSRTVTTAEIITAAKAANIHNFIMTLPLGYGTKLGVNGTQLSGGQKQRIAIARALIRNPEILLLDEATSALDPESESIVQEALDAAAAGRTTITIAHRMRAVRNADVIYVVEKGAVKEFGTHQHLMKQKGVYYSIQEKSFETL